MTCFALISILMIQSHFWDLDCDLVLKWPQRPKEPLPSKNKTSAVQNPPAICFTPEYFGLGTRWVSRTYFKVIRWRWLNASENKSQLLFFNCDETYAICVKFCVIVVLLLQRFDATVTVFEFPKNAQNHCHIQLQTSLVITRSIITRYCIGCGYCLALHIPCQVLWEDISFDKQLHPSFYMDAIIHSCSTSTGVEVSTWASYQIRKIAGCTCAGNAGNVFPTTAG